MTTLMQRIKKGPSARPPKIMLIGVKAWASPPPGQTCPPPCSSAASPASSARSSRECLTSRPPTGRSS